MLKQYENSRVERVDRVESHDDAGSSPCSTRSTRLNDFQLASLNELCVRIVFLLYAEDAEVFGRLQFHDYLKQFPAPRARCALIDLFKVLDTPPEKRDPYLEADLAAFPYVNGGLFRGEIEIPPFNDEILDLVLRKGSEEFDWSGISPVIFGAVFESTLNPETRRKGGMHYTSVANIHKVIDPLFLDRLKAMLADAKAIADKKARNAALRAFIDHLASLTFLDPACGSGNFLTETYICLRRLENEALALLLGEQSVLDLEGDTIKVSIAQFHGIEINDFAVRVAQTALWIAEHQMLRETATLLHRNLDFLPLKDYDGIVEGNALRMDWGSLLSPQSMPVEKLNVEKVKSSADLSTLQPFNPSTSFDYIIGNPPFVGYSLQGEGQKDDILALYRDEKGRPYKTAGKIDYVAGWYWKSAEYMAEHPATRCALVSTNSITQGEQVASVWKPLVERFGVSIDFAHRTFRWDSESNSKAHVHCVIVGFSCVENSHAKSAKSAKEIAEETSRTSRTSREDKMLFDGERVAYVPHINGYLFPSPDVWIEARSKPLCDVPEIKSGGKPVEGGHLIFTSEEKALFLKDEPSAARFFRRLTGSEEYINGIERWCLWLYGISPAELRAMPHVMERVAAVRDFRLASVKAATRKAAETPWQFMEIKEPGEAFIIVPKVSSEQRRYVPLGFLDTRTIPTDLAFFVPDATLYHFGVLTSNVHMAWMRAVAGRLKSDYRYSAQIVYNNFPWPEVGSVANVKVLPKPNSNAQLGTGNIGTGNNSTMATLISSTVQAILDARARYPDASLADLYDELTMPPDLRRAHQENDRAVMAAYGFSTKMTESECVAELLKRYQALIARKGDEKEQ